MTTAPAMVRLDGREGAHVCPPDTFTRWLRAAKAGDRLVYAEALFLPGERQAPVLPLLRAAYDDGVVAFTQERLGGGRFRYYVTRRAKLLRPAERFVPRAVPSMLRVVAPRTGPQLRVVK